MSSPIVVLSGRSAIILLDQFLASMAGSLLGSRCNAGPSPVHYMPLPVGVELVLNDLDYRCQQCGEEFDLVAFETTCAWRLKRSYRDHGKLFWNEPEGKAPKVGEQAKLSFDFRDGHQNICLKLFLDDPHKPTLSVQQTDSDQFGSHLACKHASPTPSTRSTAISSSDVEPEDHLGDARESAQPVHLTKLATVGVGIIAKSHDQPNSKCGAPSQMQGHNQPNSKCGVQRPPRMQGHNQPNSKCVGQAYFFW